MIPGPYFQTIPHSLKGEHSFLGAPTSLDSYHFLQGGRLLVGGDFLGWSKGLGHIFFNGPKGWQIFFGGQRGGQIFFPREGARILLY